MVGVEDPRVDDPTVDEIMDVLAQNALSQEEEVMTLAAAIVRAGGLNFALLEEATNFIADA
jgi:hypothetical protein